MKPAPSLTALLISITTIAATGCIPEHDYEGDYAMTYDVLMAFPDSDLVDARAGTADVSVGHGLNSEYLVNLGDSFCRLGGRYVAAETFRDWPFMDIVPQDCWFTTGTKTFPMSLSGTATFDEGNDRLSIVLSGSAFEPGTPRRGSATVQFTETW